jgi:hypothetical protein
MHSWGNPNLSLYQTGTAPRVHVKIKLKTFQKNFEIYKREKKRETKYHPVGCARKEKERGKRRKEDSLASSYQQRKEESEGWTKRHINGPLLLYLQLHCWDISE